MVEYNHRNVEPLIMHFMKVEHRTLAVRRKETFDGSETILSVRAVFHDSVEVFHR